MVSPDATGRQVFRPLDQLDQLNPLDQLDQLVKNPSSNQPAPPPITPPREHTFMATTPRQRRTLAVAIGVAVLLGLLGGGGIWLTRADPEPQPGALRLVQSGGAALAQSPPGHAPFAAVGSVSQLRPGQMQTLQVKVTNPDEVAYKILELTATPQDANRSCSGITNLVVSSYQSTKPGSRTYLVPRKASITIPLTIMMLNTATSQDGCKNVSFPLAFGGLATQGNGNS